MGRRDGTRGGGKEGEGGEELECVSIYSYYSINSMRLLNLWFRIASTGQPPLSLFFFRVSKGEKGEGGRERDQRRLP